jgi:8-oxo-dGTP pyrophosphatase MutT (NUDIX family)
MEGFQLVKGTIEANESPSDAAVRELHEESGLEGRSVRDLGLWDSGFCGQIWSLHLCEVTLALRDTWVHRAADDGGHDFRFFWHPLHEEPGPRWHEIFRALLAHLRGMSSNISIDTDPHLQEAASPQTVVVRSSLR